MSEHTHTIENGAAKRLERSRSDRMVAGVCEALVIAAGTIVALTLVAAAIFASIFHVHLGRGVGERSYVVAGAQDLHRNYRLGIGDLTVDLGNVRFDNGETHVGTRVDVGNLRVIVPQNVALRVHGDAQLGQVEVLGQAADGRNVDKKIDQTGKQVLVLDAHVGVGKVTVTRAVR